MDDSVWKQNLEGRRLAQLRLIVISILCLVATSSANHKVQISSESSISSHNEDLETSETRAFVLLSTDIVQPSTTKGPIVIIDTEGTFMPNVSSEVYNLSTIPEDTYKTSLGFETEAREISKLIPGQQNKGTTVLEKRITNSLGEDQLNETVKSTFTTFPQRDNRERESPSTHFSSPAKEKELAKDAKSIWVNFNGNSRASVQGGTVKYYTLSSKSKRIPQKSTPSDSPVHFVIKEPKKYPKFSHTNFKGEINSYQQQIRLNYKRVLSPGVIVPRARGQISQRPVQIINNHQGRTKELSSSTLQQTSQLYQGTSHHHSTKLPKKSINISPTILQSTTTSTTLHNHQQLIQEETQSYPETIGPQNNEDPQREWTVLDEQLIQAEEQRTIPTRNSASSRFTGDAEKKSTPAPQTKRPTVSFPPPRALSRSSLRRRPAQPTSRPAIPQPITPAPQSLRSSVSSRFSAPRSFTTSRPVVTSSGISLVSPRQQLTRSQRNRQRAVTPTRNSFPSSSSRQPPTGSQLSEVVSTTSAPKIRGRVPKAPVIPGNFGFLSSGRPFGPQNVPGRAGSDYPTFNEIPFTNFDCKEFSLPGFYADLETGCQVFHTCDMGMKKHSFLCPNGTIFNQEFFTCDWWYNVKCDESKEYFNLNAVLYKKSKNSKEENKTTLP